MKDFIRCVCLCHDVVRVKSENGDSFLTGASQDELVLLDMCEKEKIGGFLNRDSDTFQIEIYGVQETYKNLKLFEFDADRKMMTRIV